MTELHKLCQTLTDRRRRSAKLATSARLYEKQKEHKGRCAELEFVLVRLRRMLKEAEQLRNPE